MNAIAQALSAQDSADVGGGFYVPRRPLCVSLIYQAGYATVPSEIVQACIVVWRRLDSGTFAYRTALADGLVPARERPWRLLDLFSLSFSGRPDNCAVILL
jgi:hypothetical protein